MEISEFIKTRGISIKSVRVNRNPNTANDEWAKDASHYEVTFKQEGRGNNKTYSTFYSMGSAHKNAPKVDDVLDCLAMEASGAENARNFEDWANEYGYDTDSREAERTYNMVVKQAAELKAFLGATDYKFLLDEVERL